PGFPALPPSMAVVPLDQRCLKLRVASCCGTRPVPSILRQSDLPGLDLIHQGKVRDVYALSDNELLIVATDRLSAFDVVLPDPVPGKGEMLTQLSNFWFARTAHLMPNHLVERPIAEVLPPDVDVSLYARRSIVSKRLKPVPFEAIARGY